MGELKPLQRIQNWDTDAFDKFLISRAQLPFAWGTNDCALFAADGIKAITGVDIASDFRGYSNEQGAWQRIADLCEGGTTVEHAIEYIAQRFALRELEYPLMAQRGDLVTLMESERIIAGLVHLNGRHIVAVGEAGLKRFPITDVKRAWHYE